VGEVLAPEFEKSSSLTYCSSFFFGSIVRKLLIWSAQTLGIPFQVLTRIVPITPGTLISRYAQLYLGFTASALIHHFPSMIHSTGLRDGSGGQLAFYLLQPFAITFEDLVIYLGKKAGVKKSCKFPRRTLG
jgi:hypothetical protein